MLCSLTSVVKQLKVLTECYRTVFTQRLHSPKCMSNCPKENVVLQLSRCICVFILSNLMLIELYSVMCYSNTRCYCGGREGQIKCTFLNVKFQKQIQIYLSNIFACMLAVCGKMTFPVRNIKDISLLNIRIFKILILIYNPYYICKNYNKIQAFLSRGSCK